MNHEHATTSMKVLLLVFAIVLVGTLSYFVWYQKNEPDLTDYSVNTTPKKNQVVAVDNTVSCGEDAYAFELTFGDQWEGYKIKEYDPEEAIIYCYVTMPTEDEAWMNASTTNDAGYVSLFSVGVYTPQQWEAALQEANKPSELGHNDSYYWGWAPAQSYPEELDSVVDDIDKVVATFKISP